MNTAVKKTTSFVGGAFWLLFKHPFEYFKIIFPGILLAFLVLSLTYNPTHWDFYTYVSGLDTLNQPVPWFFGSLLLVGWMIFLHAAYSATEVIGKLSLIVIITPCVWALFYYNVIDVNNNNQVEWVIIGVLSIFMGYSFRHRHVLRRASGLLATEEEDHDHEG